MAKKLEAPRQGANAGEGKGSPAPTNWAKVAGSSGGRSSRSGGTAASARMPGEEGRFSIRAKGAGPEPSMIARSKCDGSSLVKRAVPLVP